jgi:hypothetical protein
MCPCISAALQKSERMRNFIIADTILSISKGCMTRLICGGSTKHHKDFTSITFDV